MTGTVSRAWIDAVRAGDGAAGEPTAARPEPRPRPGRIILLNGASSSGKSSIAEQLLPLLPDLNIRMAADSFYAATGWRDGTGAYRDLGAGGVDAALRRIRSGFHHAVAAVASAGNNVVVDHLLSEPWRLRECLELFAAADVVFVGVHCSPRELERRERERGDREPGTAVKQAGIVHAHGVYDLEVDTSSTAPPACAEQIAAYVASGAAPTAFTDLRSSLGLCRAPVQFL
jgi:chloramphenicol 3-O phosphotransferase